MGDEHRKRLVTKLEKTGAAIVSSNIVEWQNFTVMPIWLAPSLSAPLAGVLDKAIQRNLDYELENQNTNGS